MATCASCGTENPEGARFCYSCGSPIGGAVEPARESRKTVTVLFIDAVSSTSLGERMDPESLRAVMTRYFDAMREAIESHGGAVEKFIGDAVMAIFGVPTVHEDDALRACRAAIEIRSRLSELEPQIRADRGVAIEWRAGINTGPVVAGDVAAGQRIVTGDAVNVAARLEAAAAPGEILLGAETYALVRDAVSTEATEPLTLKGKSEPVPAWRLTGVSDAVGRHARPSEAPLVGRRRPLRLLEGAFQEAVEERICHLFTIVGAAGVGKSRVVEEFIGSLGDQAQVASGRCLAYGQGITYWPVTEAIRDAAGIAEGDAPEVAAGRLRELLGADPEAERVGAIVGGLLGIEDSPTAPDEIFSAIRKTFEAVARQKPLILVLDDVHWGEPTFLDLIEHIADWTRDAPILLIAVARADLLEKRPTWGGGKRWVTTMQLEPLSDVESDELVTSLLGRADLPAEFRTHISHAAEGNPLFVEELLAKLIDDGFLVRAEDGWAAAADLRELALPPTIQALLAARLDGLGSEERTVIERASVEGKVFHRGAVMELAPEPMRGHVRDRLASLMRMELVRPEQASFAGDEAFRFRHLLIRDAAYQALAKQTRSELHERFAAWLERMAADRLVEYQEIIAYHLEQAYRYRAELGPPDAQASALAERAGTLLADAGERADRRRDTSAVVDLLGRAVELLPDGPRRRRLWPILASGVYDSGDASRAERMLVDALAEADHAGDEGAAAMARLMLAFVYASTRSAELAETLRIMEEQAQVLARVGDLSGARYARAASAFVLFALGRAADAVERAAALLVQEDNDEPWHLQARESKGAGLVYGPMPVEEAVAEVERMRLEHRDVGTYRGLSRLRGLQGRLDEALELNARATAAFEDLGNRHALASAKASEGELRHQAGELGEAERLLRTAYEEMTGSGDRSFASTVAVDLGLVLLDLQRNDEALRFARIAIDTSSSDDVISQAGGRALEARVLSRKGDHHAAETLAREAVEVMRKTDYLDSHAEVTAHLAEVLHEAGKTEQAIAAARDAAALYDAKGATFWVERTQRLIDEWSRGASPPGD